MPSTSSSYSIIHYLVQATSAKVRNGLHGWQDQPPIALDMTGMGMSSLFAEIARPTAYSIVRFVALFFGPRRVDGALLRRPALSR